MKQNRLVSLALSLTLLLSLALPARAESSFPDTEVHWAQDVM